MQRILLSSGRGPLECELALGLYLRVFLARYPEARVIREEGQQHISAAGKSFMAYSSVVLELPVDSKVQTGSVRWVCQSPVRKGHRRKNWFIEVSRSMEHNAPVFHDMPSIDLSSPDKRHYKVETFRSPGKGGQKVNKVETGVRITPLASGMTAESVTARTQLANRKLAFERLREKMEHHKADQASQMQKMEWAAHDQIERGNAFATFTGLDFTPVE